MDQRQHFYIDRPIQRGIAGRLMTYFCGTWFAVFALPICAKLAFSEIAPSQLATELIKDLWFPMLISVMMLPIVTWDCIRYTNRIAGPLKRVTRALGSITENQPVEKLAVRDEDFCGELVYQTNRLVADLNRIRDEAAQERMAGTDA